MRENYIDRMVALYGLENSIVIDFCRMCEEWPGNEWNNTILRLLVEAHEASPYTEEI